MEARVSLAGSGGCRARLQAGSGTSLAGQSVARRALAGARVAAQPVKTDPVTSGASDRRTVTRAGPGCSPGLAEDHQVTPP